MQQDVNQDSGAYNIRNHGSDSNTGYAKVEGNDQNKIQPGIDNTGCNQCVSGRLLSPVLRRVEEQKSYNRMNGIPRK